MDTSDATKWSKGMMSEQKEQAKQRAKELLASMEKNQREFLKKHSEINNALWEKYAPVQASMREEARSTFSESELESLRVLVRVTFEFAFHLEHPRTTELRDYLPEDPQLREFCLQHPQMFDDFELRYAIDTIISTIEFFTEVHQAYSVLADRIESTLNWNEISPVTFREKFKVTFDEFQAESVFERKCRILLDLFRLQLVFAGFYYD
jgi:hypothetical protein